MTAVRPLPIAIVTALAALALVAIPDTGAAPTAIPALALTVLIVGLMATSAVPEYVFCALFFGLALIFQVAPADAVFSGFRSSAFWLVFGGVVLGMAADRTGLGTAVAGIFLKRIGRSLPRAMAGLAVGAVILGFLIPAAIARVITLVPVVQAMANRMGFPPGSRGRRAMLLTTIMVSFFVPMTILPANFPNVLLAGLSDSLYGVHMTYAEYMLMNFPMGGLAKAALVVGVVYYWFRDAPKADDAEMPDAEPLTPRAKRLAVIVAVTVAVWATDFAHSVPPGWVALVSAVTCILPIVGVMTPADFRGRTGGFFAVLTVATIVGLGAVLAASGAGRVIADGLMAATDFQPDAPVYAFTTFSAINIAMMLFATIPGAVAVMAPFAGTVAEATQLPLMTVLMMIVNGYSTAFFPYQASPMLAGLRIGGVSFTDGTKITFTVSAISLFTILPLTYLWWWWLGAFG